MSGNRWLSDHPTGDVDADLIEAADLFAGADVHPQQSHLVVVRFLVVFADDVDVRDAVLNVSSCAVYLVVDEGLS